MNAWGNLPAVIALMLLFLQAGCRETVKETAPENGTVSGSTVAIHYATGFSARTDGTGITYLTIRNPWPGASREYEYALVPRDKLASVTLPTGMYDAIIPVPVERIVLTSTTHIPSLEAIGQEEALVGFPGLDYISSPEVVRRVRAGEISELGANEQLNIERVLEAVPDLVVGFGVSEGPGSYEALSAAGIPVVLNGDWMEQDPLGKAEWVKFFGMLFDERDRAGSFFREVETSYREARALAESAQNRPTVLSGALYRDVWYLPAGESWAAQFLEDANAGYLWGDTDGSGSLSLSLESVLEKASEAEYWVSPSQFTSYSGLGDANPHYTRFRAFRERRIIGYASARGPGSGLLYFELGPSRPDLILKDLIYYLHPGLLPGYDPVFFKPLEP